MSDTRQPGQLYEKIVQLTGTWPKGGGKLPPPFVTVSRAASTRDDLSRVGSPTLRENRKVPSNLHKGYVQIVHTLRATKGWVQNVPTLSAGGCQ